MISATERHGDNNMSTVPIIMLCHDIITASGSTAKPPFDNNRLLRFGPPTLEVRIPKNP
tara:strand:- start:2662 stop:2838 length:177 start_codon:yes stop_codon:yes gene_type:complete